MPLHLTPQQKAALDDRDDGLHISSHYFAKAIALRSGGFTAQYGAPGLFPEKLKNDGVPAVYQTEFEAELAASRRLLDVVNMRTQMLSRRGQMVYEPMSAAELMAGLAEMKIGPTFFAFIHGSQLKRMLGWLSGPSDKDENRIPHSVRVMLALFRHDRRNIDVAEEATIAVTHERTPRKED